MYDKLTAVLFCAKSGVLSVNMPKKRPYGAEKALFFEKIHRFNNFSGFELLKIVFQFIIGFF